MIKLLDRDPTPDGFVELWFADAEPMAQKLVADVGNLLGATAHLHRR
jgi:hypothetical protein